MPVIIYLVVFAVYIPFAALKFVFITTRDFVRNNEGTRVGAVIACGTLFALGATALFFGLRAPNDPVTTAETNAATSKDAAPILEPSTARRPDVSAFAERDGTQLTTSLERPDWNVDVAIGSMRGLLKEQTSLEQEEQLRDWAVIGTVTRLALSDEGVATALRRAPPARLPYLEETQPFEYGRGRHTNVGKYGLVFFEADDPHAKSVIGKEADALRTELGFKPEQTYVFSFRPLMPESKIAVKLVRKLSETALFGAEYGYHEDIVKDAETLSRFITSIDDLSYSRRTSEGLLLAGRAREPRRRNLTIEDVAALATASKDLAERNAEFEVTKKSVYERVNSEFAAAQQRSRYGSPTYIPYGLGRNSLRNLDSPDPTDAAHFQKKYENAIADLDGPPDAPGFSLDPVWLPAKLSRDLQTLSLDLCALAPAARAISKQITASSDPAFLTAAANEYAAAAKEALLCRYATHQYGYRLGAIANKLGDSATVLPKRQLERTMGDFFDLAAELKIAAARHADSTDIKGQIDRFAAHVADRSLTFFRARNQVQCARYDGTLKGTAVGMTLFYTDLMAKLWQAVDFQRTAPTREVPGFLSSPRVELEPYWAEELAKKPATRIWFGPREDAFAKEGDEVFFAPVATRVFAKGSSGSSSKEESEPSESSRRTIGWWDRHYSAVADYEEQYHVLNQIQKWTLLLAWAKPEELSFARQVPYKDDWRYDKWSQDASNRLRFKKTIPLRSEADSPTQTECIDILQSYPFASAGGSYSISGGVSLGSEKTLELAKGIFRGVSDRVVDLAPSVPTRLAANEVASGLGRLRAGAIEIPTKSLDKSLSVIATHSESGTSLTLRSGQNVFGRLTADLNPRGVILDWREAAQARAPRLVKEFADSTSLERMTLEAGEQVASIPGGGVLIRSVNGKPAMVVGPVDAERAVLAKSQRQGTLVGVEHLDASANVVDRYEWQRFKVREGAESLTVPDAVVASFESRAPVGGQATIIRGLPSGDIRARVVGDELWVARPNSSWGELASRPTFDPVAIARIREAAKAGREAIELPPFPSDKLTPLLLSDDTAALGKFVADVSPETLQASIKVASERLVAFGDAALNRGQDKTAVELYGLAATRLGASDRSLMVRRALADLGVGDGRAAKQLSREGQLQIPDSIRGSRAGTAATLLTGAPKGDGPLALFLADGRYGLETTVRLPRTLPGRFLDSTGRAMVLKAAGETTPQLRVYIDDSFNLAKRDLEAQGEGLLVDFNHRPNVSWQEVELAGLGDLRSYPLAAADGHTFSELPRHSAASYNPTRAILIRNCATNGPANDNSATEQDPCG